MQIEICTYLYIVDFLHKADSISLLKIQNLLHGYERLIEREKGRYTQLLGKVRKLENEKKELQAVLEETRELKSMLDHQKMEWESDVSSLKYGILNSNKHFTRLLCLNANNKRDAGIKVNWTINMLFSVKYILNYFAGLG